MAKYRGDINPECLHCNQVIGRVIDEIISSCDGTVGGTDGCCWDKLYDIQFPSNPCEFCKNYENILSTILDSDKEQSQFSKETWDKCTENDKRVTKHCVKTGACAEEPPSPKNHEQMNKWCKKHFSQGNQTSCWECLSENLDCGFVELNSICENMYDCRNDTSLKKINPPRGELLDCINHFKTGDCCNPTRSTPAGLNNKQKLLWWDNYVQTNGGKQEES